MRHHRETIARLRDDAATQVHPMTFFAVVDFVRGYDDAYERVLLGGFFEWLKARGARGGNQGWPGLIEGIAFPKIFSGPDDPDYKRPTDTASERRLIDLLFDRLAAFHEERERIGVAEIFREFKRKEPRRP